MIRRVDPSIFRVAREREGEKIWSNSLKLQSLILYPTSYVHTHPKHMRRDSTFSTEYLKSENSNRKTKRNLIKPKIGIKPSEHKKLI